MIRGEALGQGLQSLMLCDRSCDPVGLRSRRTDTRCRLFSSPVSFTFFELPFVSTVSPRSGPRLGGTMVTLVGSFLVPSKMNDFPGPEARRAIEILAQVLIIAGTAIVVSSVAWNLWRIRQSLRVEISNELEKTFALFSPHGRMVLTRW